jgi:hypothetical protein
MLDDIQREVAVHLLANAMRKQRISSDRRTASGNAYGANRLNADAAYLRGMIDLLTTLHGRAFADELIGEARALEQAHGF